MRITANQFKKFTKNKTPYFLKKKFKELNYTFLNKKEEKIKILEIIKTIHKSYIKKSGKSYKKNWNNGWNENYLMYKKSSKDTDLIPKYFFKNKFSRIGDNLIKTFSKNFDYKVLKLITSYLFFKYLKNEKNIIEFGAGTGHNLINLSKINKSANLYGLDWSKSSQKIFKLVSKKYKKILGYKFDYYKPSFNKKMHLKKNEWSCFTIASLEQIGKDFKPFLKFLQKQKPNIVVNLEPINELMNQNKILDYLSVEYSKKRNYLDTYYLYLKKLEEKKIIKIIEKRKSYFGSFYINGYSIIVWKYL